MAHKAIFFDVQDREHADLERQLKSLGEVSAHLTHEPLNTQTVALAADCQIISTFVTSPITEELLAQLPNLKAILTRSTGFNHIALEATAARGITVCNVPTYGEHTVAEYAFALLLALSRKIPQVLDAVKHGRLEHKDLVGFDLAGKTLGIIGTGHIGQHTARIAKGFEMSVLGYDPFPNEQAAQQIGYTYESLDELLGKSDVISLHAPYTPQTHHLLDHQAFEKVKQGAYLINTARGELVDTQALVEALHSGKLGGAGLDVLEGEELLGLEEEVMLLRPGDHKKELLLMAEQSLLQKFPNVILSNHNAFNSAEALAKIDAVTLLNLKAYINGQPVNVVSSS